MCNSSLFTPASSRTHSFVFFAVHEARRIFLEGPIEPCFRCMGPGSLEETGTAPGMLEQCLQVVPRYRPNGVRSSINQLDSCVQQQTLADAACPSVCLSVCHTATNDQQLTPRRCCCCYHQWRRQDFVTGGSEVWVYSRGKSGPALGGTDYRLMPSACRLIVRAKL